MKKIVLSFYISIVYGSLIAPEDGSVLNRIHVLFEWGQVPGALSYDLQISEDINFTSLASEITDFSLAYIEKNYLNWETSYYWRIRANFSNHSSDWLTPYLFTTSEALSSSSINYIEPSQYQEGITVFGAFFNYFSAKQLFF